MKKDEKYSLQEIIDYCIDTNFKDDDFCLYGDDEPLGIDKFYLICDYPQVINDQDVYPIAAKKESLWIAYYGDQFVDVIYVALEKNPNATKQELVEALNYYLQNDNFM